MFIQPGEDRDVDETNFRKSLEKWDDSAHCGTKLGVFMNQADTAIFYDTSSSLSAGLPTIRCRCSTCQNWWGLINAAIVTSTCSTTW